MVIKGIAVSVRLSEMFCSFHGSQLPCVRTLKLPCGEAHVEKNKAFRPTTGTNLPAMRMSHHEKDSSALVKPSDDYNPIQQLTTTT